jgi:hypothetical protein
MNLRSGTIKRGPERPAAGAQQAAAPGSQATPNTTPERAGPSSAAISSSTPVGQAPGGVDPNKTQSMGDWEESDEEWEPAANPVGVFQNQVLYRSPNTAEKKTKQPIDLRS